MATTKERILVTLTPDMARELTVRAKREKSPRATVAARMLRDAIEDISDEEDRYLSRVGDAIATNPGKLISSEEFWKRVAKRRGA